MTKTSLTALALSAGLFMAACSPADEPVTDVPPETTGDSAMTETQDAGEVTGSDALLPDDTDETDIGVTGSDAALSTLQPVTEDNASTLEGELGCAFQTADDGNTILVARADVAQDDRPTAVINNDGFGVQLYGQQPGGFDGLETTAGTFAGEGVVVVVELGDATLDGSETEASSRAATMTVNRSDGATRSYDGDWTCGP